MRNRCIELCLIGEQQQQRAALKSASLAELSACLSSEGIPGCKLPQAMAAAHTELAAYYAKAHE